MFLIEGDQWVVFPAILFEFSRKHQQMKNFGSQV